MTLLTLDRVWKRFARGDRGIRELVALRDVSLELEIGELVAVVGQRRSGRTTLLHVAAGLQAPSAGTVRLGNADLARESLLGVTGGIGYCTTRFAEVIGNSALEHVAAPLLGGDVSMLKAHARAHEALRRVGATACAELAPDELDAMELMRATIARAIVTEPRLLLVDEPTLGVRLSERDAILELLRSLAHDDDLAVLVTVDSAAELAGADRALSLDAGELRGQTRPPAAAPVVSLHRHRTGSSA
jgi:predicted ABC-type transport system involved in lysophospholipase L1 biosynthesis ATPase subunit